MRTVFACPRLLTPDEDLSGAGLVVEAGRVVAVLAEAPSGAVELPGTVVPGLVDLQVNGFDAWRVLDATAEAVGGIASALPGCGVTAWLPTVISAPEADRFAAMDAVVAARDTGGARVLGVHLEGPWISPARAGVHDPDVLEEPGSPSLAGSLDRHPRLVRLVTLAPELPGGLAAVGRIVASGAVASIGHSQASDAETRRAADAGVTMATHLFNAMPPLHHREPGVVGAVLDDPRVTPTVIADGVHVAPFALRLVYAMKGRDGFAVVSDAVAGERGGSPAARRPDGTLAGSHTGLGDALRTAVEAGIPLPDAVRACTVVPARLLGELDVGRLRPGAHADLVVLDPSLAVAAVYMSGHRVWP